MLGARRGWRLLPILTCEVLYDKRGTRSDGGVGRWIQCHLRSMALVSTEVLVLTTVYDGTS